MGVVEANFKRKITRIKKALTKEGIGYAQQLAEDIARFGCCEKARPMNCVCAFSFECPTHGQRHIGTHD